MARKSSKAVEPPEPATPQTEPAQETPPPEPPEQASPLPPAQELLDLIAAARSGDATVLPRLRQVLDDHPEVWRHAGNLAQMTKQLWINLITGDDPLIGESIIRQAAAMRAELEGEAPTALDRLLVDQVVASWLEKSFAEIALAAPDQPLRQARHRVQHAEVAQRKYLAAIKALTTVRTLRSKAVMPNEPLRVFDEKRA